MTLLDPHCRRPRAACQTIRRPPRGGDHQGVNQPSRRPLRGLRSRVIENPGMGDRIQRNTQSMPPRPVLNMPLSHPGLSGPMNRIAETYGSDPRYPAGVTRWWPFRAKSVACSRRRHPGRSLIVAASAMQPPDRPRMPLGTPHRRVCALRAYPRPSTAQHRIRRHIHHLRYARNGHIGTDVICARMHSLRLRRRSPRDLRAECPTGHRVPG
jgi:hypothetical protein